MRSANRERSRVSAPQRWGRMPFAALSLGDAATSPLRYVILAAGPLAMLAFAAAIVGGFTSLPGCVIGGVALGIIQNFVGVLISPQAISVTPFFVIMLVLMLFPQGLLGEANSLKKV